jgi:hypothetical protein
MVSGLADGVCDAAWIVLDEDGLDEIDDTQRSSGEGVTGAVDEAEGVTGAASSQPVLRTASANPSDAPTTANVSDALRIVRRERGRASER